MPMIFVTVLPGTQGYAWEQADRDIQAAARSQGVEGSITIWPLLLLNRPSRLSLRYESRQEVPDPNALADAMAEAAARALLVEVEAVVVKLDQETTGIRIAPNPTKGEWR